MQALLKVPSTLSFPNIFLIKDPKACWTKKKLSICQNFAHVQTWANGLVLGLPSDQYVHSVPIFSFSFLLFQTLPMQNSEIWACNTKVFWKKFLNLLKICVNICWDLLQATYSKGRQKGVHTDGNETDGSKQAIWHSWTMTMFMWVKKRTK